MPKIIQNGHPTLRKIATAVPIKDITGEKIKGVIKDMKDALAKEYDGVAIAAPQINIPLRIFVVSKKVFDEQTIKDENLLKEYAGKDVTFINPKFLKISNDKKLLSEGCLSVRPMYGKVRRSTRATVEAYDEKGKKFVMAGSGLLAHIFQHETDHLDGVLFIDKAKDLHEEDLEELKNAKK